VAFEIPKINYTGKVKEITIGAGNKTATVGGRDCYPFHLFEGSMPNKPIIAMEIWDMEPGGWPEAAIEPFKDVISDPPAWAKKCVDEYGAKIIVVQLKSTDPNDKDRPVDEAADMAKKIVDAVSVPVVFWGTAVNEKDEQVLKKIAEVCEGENVSLSPVEEPIHKGVGASALGYKHTVVASTPIDINLAKQLNILLGNLGVPDSQLLNDPTTGGLGYGIEYAYSVSERISQAGLTQEDEKLQIPMINNLGNEIWKCKEAGQPKEEVPTMGEPGKRAIMMEAVGAVCYLLAGSDILIMRHPESIKLAQEMIDDFMAEN
jgi:acetyl-CoA decarbonylase/synthase complex subunit delta